MPLGETHARAQIATVEGELIRVGPGRRNCAIEIHNDTSVKVGGSLLCCVPGPATHEM